MDISAHSVVLSLTCANPAHFDPPSPYVPSPLSQREGYIHFFYEGTVGAGLPVMATVKQLQETGDKVTRIEGILSGRLA